MAGIKAKLIAVLASVALAASMAVPAFAYEQVEDTVSYGHGYNDAGYLVIHETANPGASAYNHTLLWSRDDTYAVHYVMELDGSVVYHTVPDWALCWHVGNGNYATVGIELAHADNWEDFSAQWDQAVAWAGDYLNSRGWGIDRLLSHNDCAWIWGGTDHTDPTGYFAEYGRSWDQFKQDVGAYIGGFHGDCAATYPCGKISAEAQRLIDVTQQSFFEGIRFAREGQRLSDISAAVQKYVEDNGYSVVREYVGHGIGRKMHESPEVPNFGAPGHGPRLLRGMTIAVEPMVNAGGAAVRVMPDGWTVKTQDGSLAAHYENTILITNGEAELLTLPEI